LFVPIDTDGVAPEDPDHGPNLPLFQGGNNMAQFDLVIICNMSLPRSGFHLQPGDHEFPFFGCKKACRLRLVGEEEWSCERHTDGQETLEDENPRYNLASRRESRDVSDEEGNFLPSPSFQSSNSVHF
jgi:hypothetical protein